MTDIDTLRQRLQDVEAENKELQLENQRSVSTSTVGRQNSMMDVLYSRPSFSRGRICKSTATG